jgi:hypothetical protein
VSFFDPPPTPERMRNPFGGVSVEEPADRVGGPLTLTLVIGKSKKAAVVVRDAVAYPQGVSFTIETVSPDEELLRSQFGLGGRMRERPLPAEYMRFGVEYADGKKATNIPFGVLDYRPATLLLRQGGGGAGGRMRWSYWLSPLPTANPFSFACEWPVADISLTHTALDADLLSDAASRSSELWPGGD